MRRRHEIGEPVEKLKRREVDPDLRILESLPLVRHLPLLQQAGSVKPLPVSST